MSRFRAYLSECLLWAVRRTQLEIPIPHLVELECSIHALDDGTSRCIHTPHSLRSTTTTQLLKHGVPLVKERRQLGHKDPKTTEGYYAEDVDPKTSDSHEFPI